MRKVYICLISSVIAVLCLISFSNFDYISKAKYISENDETYYDIKGEENDQINLKATDSYDGEPIKLNWNPPKKIGQNDRFEYRLYAKNASKSDEHYKSIPIKDTVKVLNIYPGETSINDKGEKITSISNNLKKWMNSLAMKPATKEKYDVKDEINNEYYDYIREPNSNNIYTNAKGVIQTDENGNPKINENGEYEYAKDEDGKEKKGLISVEEINIDDFNKDADNKKNDLQNNGEYCYDVVYEGAADCNNFKDLSKAAVEVIREYIGTGRGYLCGHDTFGIGSPNRNELSKCLKIKLGTKEEQNEFCYGCDKVKIEKPGLLINYPWDVASSRTELTVPFSHSNKEYAFGDVWVKYSKNKYKNNKEQDNTKDTDDEKVITDKEWKTGTNNFYLTTSDNTAMIQTGHRTGQATPDEQKLLANTLFYLSQVTAETSWEDHYCQDVDAPQKPEIDDILADYNGERTLKFNKVQDIGTKYNFVVKAHNLNGIDPNQKSKPVSATITSGLRGYLIYTDNKEDTDIEDVISNYENDNRNLDTNNLNKMGIKVIEGDELKNFKGIFNLGIIKDNFWVHIAAIDNAGNISETSSRYFDFPKILDLELEDTFASKSSEIWAIVTLNNICEKNTTFAINDVKNILSQEVEVKYDNTKLKYNGACTCDRAFRILSENDKDGIITFNVLCRNINNYDKKASMLALSFDVLDSGETDISIDNGKFENIDNEEITCLPAQLGKCTISIKK